MAMPSSPPLPPELELPTSPPPLSEEGAELPLRPSELAAASRKRQFSDYASLSSDPVFSEGPSDAEEEGVDRGRRKKLLKGPWYNLRRASTRSLIRTMARRERAARNADSGVFMGSDWSDDSIDSTSFSRRRFEGMHVHDHSLPTAPPPSSPPPKTPLSPSAEQLASKTINHCLETGREAVDLSDLGFSSLPNAVLRPLHQLIKHTHTDLDRPPSEDEFTPFTPSIQLFLSGNKLTALPAELFRLRNIAVLSLRNNELDVISPSIGKLPHLKELNIAQNRIEYLPWEMLDLMHCRGAHRHITVRPNPFIDPLPDLTGPSPLPRPSCTPSEFKEHLGRWGETTGAFFQQMKLWYSEEGVSWTLRHELELRLKLGRTRFNRYLTETSRAGVEVQQQCNEQLIYVGSSAVRFFDIDGSPCRTPAAINSLPPTDNLQLLYTAVIDPLANAPPACITSSLPSLYELALRKVQAAFHPHDLWSLQDDLPSTIIPSLQKACSAAVENGNETCSVCGAQFIIARAEWMEYWFNGFPSHDALSRENVLPFLRRVCGWGCARVSEVGSFRF